jgi:hypothetical protein
MMPHDESRAEIATAPAVDRLMDFNRKAVDFLKTKGIEPTWIETAGAHTWMV